MKIGSLGKLFAAAVAAALTLPGYAQQGESAAGQTGEARSGNAGQNDDASGVDRAPGNRDRAPGRTARPDRPVPGAAVRDEAIRDEDSGTRTANVPPQGDDRAAAGQGQRGQLGDQGIVRWIAAGNEAEIRVNEAAQQKAQNEQVKQFAQKMVDEHTKLGQQLQQATGQSGQQGASGEGASRATAGTATGETQERTARRVAADAADDAREEAENAVEEDAPGRAANRDRNREGRQAGGMRGGNSPFLAFHEEIKRQCAESTIQALNEKQGAEFDHAFIHQQIVEHMGMLDTLKVAEQHASPDLKKALQQARQHTQQHLEQAKQIAMQLDKEGQR